LKTKRRRVIEAANEAMIPTSVKPTNEGEEYVHYNPVKAGLCILPEDYYYSSAKFYATGIDDFDMLTHCDE
jgi:hypothetical protein